MNRFRNILSEIMDDMAVGFYDYPALSIRGRIVDPEKFDIVPKPKYFEEQINKTQELIDALDRQHDTEEKYYQERRKRLVSEKESIMRERDKNKSG